MSGRTTILHIRRMLFGWKNRQERRHRTALYMFPRGNALIMEIEVLEVLEDG
jgi:hypothetical protein